MSLGLMGRKVVTALETQLNRRSRTLTKPICISTDKLPFPSMTVKYTNDDICFRKIQRKKTNYPLYMTVLSNKEGFLETSKVCAAWKFCHAHVPTKQGCRDHSDSTEPDRYILTWAMLWLNRGYTNQFKYGMALTHIHLQNYKFPAWLKYYSQETVFITIYEAFVWTLGSVAEKS